jgi:L-asparaginase II
MRLTLEVIVWRGSIAESRHRVLVAVCDQHGNLVAGSDEAGRVTTFRSAAKPFQLLPLVERGHAERFRFSEEELAVMAASHTGSARHVALVEGILARIGLDASHLACGYHEPIDRESRVALQLHPERRSPVYNNCSGKHAGMLALALGEGWPTRGYQEAEHPVQRLMRETVAQVCGMKAADLQVAVDGCSVQVFALPLAGTARAYAVLATARPGAGPREGALARIRDAMRGHPWVVGGEGRLSTVLMERAPGLVAKGGAEGLQCVGWLERGLGVSVKVEDGGNRAVGPATMAALESIGALSEAERAALADRRSTPLTNHAGLTVGRVEAVVEVAART